jgi:hypothetical protein
MSSLAVTAVVLICLLAGAGLGMLLRAKLPEHHLSPESTDVVKLATGLMATLAALVLSLLISSANNSHNLIDSEYRTALATVVALDRDLGSYGSDAEGARGVLRAIVVSKFAETWPGEDFGPAGPAGIARQDSMATLEEQILRLAPKDEAQKWYLAQALQMAANLAQIRWLLRDEKLDTALPTPFLIVLISWTGAIFVSFGLFARPNGTVLVALAASAMAVAGAVFLILELNSPFTGLIQLSSAPAHATAAILGQ